METRLPTDVRAAPTPSFTPAHTGLLQRKCACGGLPGISGACEGCSKSRLSLQRAARNSELEAPNSRSVPPIVHEVLRSPGQPLDATTRSFMEPHFNHSFSNVRVHTDARAAKSARAVNALAYTVGRDIVFGAGQYAPGTQSGRKLLAHELMHTVQQGATGSKVNAKMEITDANDSSEQEAEAAATAVVEGRPVTATAQTTAQLARQQPPDAGAPDAGPSDAGTPAPVSSEPFRENQVACVIRLGGCASSRPAGLPTPAEIAQYNATCRSETTYRGPDVTPSDQECAHPPNPPALSASLIFARNLETLYPRWRFVIPDCPCTDQQARANPSAWSGPGACMQTYHPGATTGYRSAQGFASVPNTSHGQQCCYDATGALITDGQSAGTPDVVAPIGAIDTVSHYFNDVVPFNDLGWQVYNQYWIPNRGRDCQARTGG